MQTPTAFAAAVLFVDGSDFDGVAFGALNGGDITVFNDKAYEIFGINIEDNVPLMEYLNEVME